MMSFISSGLSDTDHCDDDADNCHYNTDKLQNNSEHQIVLTFRFIFHMYVSSSDNGSSQNVLILAKGEPLPVLVTLMYILSYLQEFARCITNISSIKVENVKRRYSLQ